MSLADDCDGFDPSFASPADWAAMYRARGLQVVPAYRPGENPNWKRPNLEKWREFRDALVPDAVFARWYGQGGKYTQNANMGVIAGRASGNLFVVDLDLYKTPSAGQWWDITLGDNMGVEPETWRQRTGGGGLQLFFRAPAGWKCPTNKTPIGVDIRGQGGFAMMPPSRHESGKDYEWEAGFEPWSIEIETAGQWLLDAVTKLVEQYGGDTEADPHAPAVQRQNTLSPTEQFNAFGKQVDGREHQMMRLVWGAVVNWYRDCPIQPGPKESEARMLEAFGTYERNVKSRILDARPNAERLEAEGRGITEFRGKWRRAMEQWDTEVSQAAKVTPRAVPNQDSGSQIATSEPVAPVDDGGDLSEVDFGDLAGRPIEPRQWLLGTILCRGYLSSVIAGGAVGKTSLVYAWVLEFITGKKITGSHVFTTGNVLVVSLEDNDKEVHRRIRAACLHHRIDEKSLAGRLFVSNPGGEAGKLLTVDKRGQPIKGLMAARLRRSVIKRKIDFVVLDPFVKTHSVDENSNSLIDDVVQILTDLAIELNVSVIVPHHTNKGGADPGNADKARGASAMKDAARLVYSLAPMTVEEAKSFDVTEEKRKSIVRLDNAKVNIAPPMAEASWFRLVSVDIGNGTEMYPAGDHVQAVEPWDPPNLFSQLSQPVIDQILSEIDRGTEDGNFYTDAPRTTRGAWSVVTKHCPTIGEGGARRVIAAWVNSKQLVRFNYRNPETRKTVDGLNTRGAP